tara:strand:+ start:214 stop:444 length:231 start_codon:yes stop_codon:yes gene_type:complete
MKETQIYIRTTENATNGAKHNTTFTRQKKSEHDKTAPDRQPCKKAAVFKRRRCFEKKALLLKESAAFKEAAPRSPA